MPPGEAGPAIRGSPRRLPDRLIGLGANDAKGCVTAMLEAFRRPRGAAGRAETGWHDRPGVDGAGGDRRRGAAGDLDRLRPLDAAVVGEPTGLTPMTAQRGC